MSREFTTLIGMKITGAGLSDKGLSLVTAEGQHYLLVPEGDCCSHTWIESVNPLKALLGTVTNVQASENVRPEEEKGGEYIEFYGLEITTKDAYGEEQTAVIDFRNSSNGYYGGYLLLEEGK